MFSFLHPGVNETQGSTGKKNAEKCILCVIDCNCPSELQLPVLSCLGVAQPDTTSQAV